MKANPDQIARITHYEALFDEITAAVSALKQAEEAVEQLDPSIAALRAYYEGDDWKKDFSDDEAGLLPTGLKRGVLSEDGVYLLLETLKELKT